jgi:hypothetical protein
LIVLAGPGWINPDALQFDCRGRGEPQNRRTRDRRQETGDRRRELRIEDTRIEDREDDGHMYGGPSVAAAERAALPSPPAENHRAED